MASDKMKPTALQRSADKVKLQPAAIRTAPPKGVASSMGFYANKRRAKGPGQAHDDDFAVTNPLRNRGLPNAVDPDV